MTSIVDPFPSSGTDGPYVGRDANEIHLEFTSDLLSHKPRRMVFPASISSNRDPKFWELDLNSMSKKNVFGFHFNLRQADEKIHSIKVCVSVKVFNSLSEKLLDHSWDSILSNSKILNCPSSFTYCMWMCSKMFLQSNSEDFLFVINLKIRDFSLNKTFLDNDVVNKFFR
ncbi:hypothetical protein TNIN_440851 [Trichonephila inaurata madagascariensis]|uniref:Uncharacterized protein n=1 Tax=Trichonephila inaurata madagascariensis TaxID=2747483 RepID=A0A8X6YG15_9ARAC|nr:hypothetical protein TNIN_440851 [Trichonephila inaurata madagascariensis]